MNFFFFVDSLSKRFILISSTLGAFLTPFMGSSTTIALPAISYDLGMDALLMGWTANSFLITAAMFLVPAGRIADIYGRKRIYTYGLALFSLSSLFSGLATSPSLLIFARIIQGAGGAMIFGNSVAILTSAFPASERGRVLGINVAAIYLGLSAGPYLGGLLTDYFGWRSIFFATSLLGLVTVLLIAATVKDEWAPARGEKIDFIGFAIYGIMLFNLMYAFTRPSAILAISFLASGLLAFFIFIRWVGRTKYPILDPGMFKNNSSFTFSNLAALINYSATFAPSLLLSLYLQYIKGLSPDKAGLVLISAPVVQALFSPLAGRLSDRWEPRIIASVGMTLTSVTLVTLSFLTRETPVAFIVIILLIFGLGFALFSSPNTNAAMTAIESRFYGVASATIATMRQIGMALSISVTMLLFSLYIGPAEITPANYDDFLESMQAAFVIFSILCIFGILASLVRGRVR